MTDFHPSDRRFTPIERAFQLASSGMRLDEVKRTLRREHYYLSTIIGPTLLKQLREVALKGTSPRGGDRPSKPDCNS